MQTRTLDCVAIRSWNSDAAIVVARSGKRAATAFAANPERVAVAANAVCQVLYAAIPAEVYAAQLVPPSATEDAARL